MAERTRIEAGRVPLVDRLRGSVGRPVSLRCAGAGPASGRLDQVGPDWLLLSEAAGAELLVPLRSLVSVAGLVRPALPAARGAIQLGLRSVLRGIVRDRAPVRAVLLDGTPVDGTPDRVGADYLEIAEHAVGRPRRPGAVLSVRTVPLGGLGVLRRW